MAEQFYTILTNAGKAAIANASALGNKVDFKTMALGDGGGQYYNPTDDQTSLVNEVYSAQLNHVQVDETNPNWIELTMVISGAVGGFAVREVGVFDTNDVLLAIGKYPETYKPLIEDGSAKDLIINMILEVSNASVVELKIDPSVILATREEVLAVSNRLDAHDSGIASEEGRHGIRLWQGKYEIKIDGVWHEFTSGKQFPVGNTKSLTVSGVANSVIEITWGDPNDSIIIDENGDEVLLAKWGGTLVLAKKDSYPVNEEDGIEVVNSTTRDEYMEQPLIFDGALDGEEWFFMAFPYTDDGVYTIDSHNRGSAIARDKNLREAPVAPSISNLEFDSVTVTGDVGTVVSLDLETWHNSPHTFTGLVEETDYVAYAKYIETDTHLESPVSEGKNFKTPSDMPGGSDFAGGDMSAGYFGVVPSSELFTGSEIASACGITQGTAQFNDEGWLKFAIDGKIIYKSKKPFRHSISWDHINSKGCVDGTKTVSKDGHTYKVRLMKGALTDPSKYNDSDRGAKGSEWNRLMLPVHVNAKDQNWAYPAYVESNIPYWGVDFTDADLHTHSSHGSGSYHWCQEVSGGNASFRVGRGHNGVSYSAQYGSSDALRVSVGRPFLSSFPDTTH